MGRKRAKAHKTAESRARMRDENGKRIAAAIEKQAATAAERTKPLQNGNDIMAFAPQASLETDEDQAARMEFLRLKRRRILGRLRTVEAQGEREDSTANGSNGGRDVKASAIAVSTGTSNRINGDASASGATQSSTLQRELLQTLSRTWQHLA